MTSTKRWIKFSSIGLAAALIAVLSLSFIPNRVTVEPNSFLSVGTNTASAVSEPEEELVESIWLRTKNSKVFHSYGVPNRDYHDIYLDAVHYEVGHDREVWADNVTTETIYWTTWEDIDNTLELASELSPWDWQMVKADYHVYILEDFTYGQILKFEKADPHETVLGDVAFQPMALQWTNDLDQIHEVSMPQSGMLSVVDNKIQWTDAYGSNIDFSWTCSSTRLLKLLTIDSLDSLPTPEQYILDGGNPVLRLDFIFDPSSEMDIYIDGTLWDKKSDVPTFGTVEFKLGDEILWGFMPLWVWDSSGTNEISVVQKLEWVGGKLFVSVRVPYEWIQNATFPIYIDTVVDEWIETSSDDANELVSDGSMDLTDTIIDIGSYTGGATHAGFRFTGIDTTDVEDISTAYLEFYPAQSDSGAVSYTWYGEAVASAATFTSDAYNISSRDRTTASVTENPPVAWVTGTLVQTSDLSNILNEVFNRGDWVSGNDLAILNIYNSGSGERRLRSWDYNDHSKAPKLHFENPTEVSYYFDTYDVGTVWETTPAYMVDNITTNYASTNNDNEQQLLTETTGPGTDLGTITKVELRAYGYGDGNDRIDFSFDSGQSPEYQLTMPGSADWSLYADVTADVNVGGWTWAKVQDPTPNLWVQYDKQAAGNILYCAKVEIRVTYTTAAPPTVTTQAVDNILKTKSYGHGTITVANPACSKRGVCWNTTGSPTVADSKSEETDSFGVGTFSRQMTGLSAGEHYYVKAYAYNAEGYGYGNEVEFGTLPVDCEVLFPNAVGDEESITNEIPADADHYACVDEEFYDDDTSYVKETADGFHRDLYHLPASAGSGTITRIVVHFRCKVSSGSGLDLAKASIKSNSTVTDGPVKTITGNVWEDFTQEWALNPADTEAWEWADIDALQIGVSLEAYTGPQNYSFCTQVYVVVYFSDIDVGAPAIDRASASPAGYTSIVKNNPANASGMLHTVEVFANANMTGLRVGTFYTTNGNTLKCRDSEAIGSVVAGARRVFTGLSIDVVAGDYIGCYFTFGDIQFDASGFAGIWAIEAEYIDPNDETEYTFYAGYAISLYGYGDIVEADITWGTASEFESGVTEFSQCCEIDTNKFVVAYCDIDDDRAGKARVGTVSGTTITWGDISEFCGDLSTAWRYLGVCKLDTDKFVVVYIDSALQLDGYARVGTVSGTTISWGTAKEFHHTGSVDTGIRYPSCCQLGTDKFAIVYMNGTDVEGCVCICTVSDSTITSGTPFVFEGGIGGSWCCKLDTDKFVAFYSDGSDGKACAFTVVGTTPTAGTIKAIDTATSGALPLDCCQLDTDKFLIVWNWDDSTPFCVTASSKISMASGYKRAEDVRVGDWLISYDTEAKQFVNRRVIKVQKNIEPYLLVNNTLKVGYGHPVWCNGRFMPANEVRIGDLLLDSRGKEQSVFSIESHEEPVDAYDFVLDSEPHTFFADGYLVHNQTYKGKIEICTVSGTTITEGAEVELNPSITRHAGLAKIDATHFAVVYPDGGNSYKGTSRYCSFSGTTITLGDEEIFHDAYTKYTDVCLISPNKIAVAYQDDGDVNDIGEAIIGDTPTGVCSPNIVNTPISYDFGVVAESSSTGTTINYFTVTNNSGGAVSITIKGTDMTGGVTWTLSDTATPGTNIYGLKCGLDDDDDNFDIIVKKNATYNDLVSGLADSASQDWGLQLLAPSTTTDGDEKTGTVTLTATCD